MKATFIVLLAFSLCLSVFTGCQTTPAKTKAQIEAEQKAFAETKAKAEQNDPHGQSALGYMYEKGQGVEKDEKKAVKWYRKAAEQGNAYGQYNLGAMYDKGMEVEKDEKESAKWYRKSAEQNYSNAQYNLGVAYANGQGVEKDMIECLAWWIIAAQQRQKNAIEWKTKAESKMRLEEIAKAEARAKELKKRIDDKSRNIATKLTLIPGFTAKMIVVKNPAPTNPTGPVNPTGPGPGTSVPGGPTGPTVTPTGPTQPPVVVSPQPQPLPADFASLKALAEKGDAKAQSSLGDMCVFGESVRKSLKTAYAWYDIASTNGYVPAEEFKAAIAKKMTPDEIAKARELRKEMVKKNPKLLK